MENHSPSYVPDTQRDLNPKDQSPSYPVGHDMSIGQTIPMMVQPQMPYYRENMPQPQIPYYSETMPQPQMPFYSQNMPQPLPYDPSYHQGVPVGVPSPIYITIDMNNTGMPMNTQPDQENYGRKDIDEEEKRRKREVEERRTRGEERAEHLVVIHQTNALCCYAAMSSDVNCCVNMFRLLEGIFLLPFRVMRFLFICIFKVCGNDCEFTKVFACCGDVCEAIGKGCGSCIGCFTSLCNFKDCDFGKIFSCFGVIYEVVVNLCGSWSEHVASCCVGLFNNCGQIWECLDNGVCGCLKDVFTWDCIEGCLKHSWTVFKCIWNCIEKINCKD